MKLLRPTLLAASVSAVLAACSSGESTPPSTSYSLRGSVPGTLIEAFCDDGSYYSTTSDSSGGTLEHPFELELPNNLVCRVVMTTNENTANAVVTPIGFFNINVSSIAFTSNNDIDVGYVDLKMEPDPGCFIVPPAPTYDMNCDGIVDRPIYIEIELPEFEIADLVVDPLDDDRDDILDAYEDDDNDGIPNIKDDDRDMDDYDGDGIDNKDDVDDDNDGVHDDVDDDDDNDGIPDDDDHDDDNDGIDDDHDDDHDGHDDDHAGNGTASTPSNDEPNAGRLLAATQCAQCHGTDGYSSTGIDSIAGESYRELLEETVEDASDPHSLMGFQGSAFQDNNLSTELEAIADYLSKR